jgi:hypothetical protein
VNADDSSAGYRGNAMFRGPMPKGADDSASSGIHDPSAGVHPAHCVSVSLPVRRRIHFTSEQHDLLGGGVSNCGAKHGNQNARLDQPFPCAEGPAIPASVTVMRWRRILADAGKTVGWRTSISIPTTSSTALERCERSIESGGGRPPSGPGGARRDDAGGLPRPLGREHTIGAAHGTPHQGYAQMRFSTALPTPPLAREQHDTGRP